MRTYDEKMEKELTNIYGSTRNLFFSKNMAAAIVGGRSRLERLVDRGIIRKNEKSEHQHGKWMCSATDVLRNAAEK